MCFFSQANKQSAFDYTAVVAQNDVVIVDVVQKTSTVMAAVEVVTIPLAVVIAFVVPFNGIIPSHSTCPLFFPRVDHMRDNPYLHAQ